MQKYFGARIADLLPKINREIFIPSIQRPYVWEPEQIIRLFDSLMRGYPINTFLFWELHPEHFGDWDIYNFVCNFQQGNTHNEPAIFAANQSATLVLDGQQRLTSLLIALTGTYHVRNGKRGRAAGYVAQALFFDLLESPHDEKEEDDDSTVKELYYQFKFAPVEKPPKNNADNFWFKVSQISQVTDRDQLAALIDKLCLLRPDLTAASTRILKNNLTRLFEVVHEEHCLAYYLEKEQSYDKVLDIFIRANDGGTKLSKADLLMSMVTLRWDQFNARDETEALTTFMRDALTQGQSKAFDRDFLLRCGLYFNDLDAAFQLRNFTPRNIAIIEKSWSEVKQALRLSTELFVRYGMTGPVLMANNAVMLIAMFIFKLNTGKPLSDWQLDADNAERIRVWIGSVLFLNLLGAAGNSTAERYRRIVNEHIQSSDRFPLEALAEFMPTLGRTMNYTDEVVGRFIAQEASGRLGRMSLSLLYRGADTAQERTSMVHVFPPHRLLEERLRTQGVTEGDISAFHSWSARLGNYMLLTEDEARDYYAMDFEDWATSRSADFWTTHHLPNDPALYDEFYFLDFIQARKKLITQRLQHLYQTGEDTEPVQAEALA